MSWDFEKITATAIEEIAKASDHQQLEALRIQYLGSKGLIKEIYASLPTLSDQDKPRVGKEVNVLRGKLTEVLDDKKKKRSLAAPLGLIKCQPLVK